MEFRGGSRSSLNRQPLEDLTKRVHNVAPAAAFGPTPEIQNDYAVKNPHGGRSKQMDFDKWKRAQEVAAKAQSRARSTRPSQGGTSNVDKKSAAVVRVPNPRHSTATQASHASAASNDAVDKRASQFSNVSSNASSLTRSKLKYYIGPWELGKTLGMGSCGRVRLVRHSVTRQLAAVKIVPRTLLSMQQSGSMVKIEKIDKQTAKPNDGSLRIPLALEREVAFLKLVEHPNIMKLLDIWESRQEIYLVTEYVENGDLFQYINAKGALAEDEALWYFRQILRAVEYCHSFGIAHRDLKPENILLKENGTIKIADFGMACLQQDMTQRLRTACGSPHYAAPEVLNHEYYQGSHVDVWSMGVILFAMLAARLPFDEPDQSAMMDKARVADYVMPDDFSREAKNLISRILVVDPWARIRMYKIWKTDLLHKYRYLDQHMEVGPRDYVRQADRSKPISSNEVDHQILRQLKSMWYTYSDDQLIQKLGAPDKNDQKQFYYLLLKYRENQQENYKGGDLPTSQTDFHHMKPVTWAKRISTCQFTEPARSGHGRCVSRFTVISNVPEEAEHGMGTVRSYDPYNAARTLPTGESQVSHAKVVIHRNGTETAIRRNGTVVSRTFHSYKSTGGKRMNSQRTAASSRENNSPRNSIGSIPSSRQGVNRVHAASRHKRGVDFSSVRRQSTKLSRRPGSIISSRHSDYANSIAGDNTTFERDQFAGPHKKNSRRGGSDNATQSMVDMGRIMGKKRHGETSAIWNEELKQLGNSIAKDCDDAFGSSMLSEEETQLERQGSPFSISLAPTRRSSQDPGSSVLSTHSVSRPWDSRPLPPPPPEDASTPEAIHRDRAVPQRTSSSTGPNVITYPDRRTVSTPVYNQYGRYAGPLPSINEGTPEAMSTAKPDKYRNASAPPLTPGMPTPHDNRGLDYLKKTDRTIWMVNSPSASNSKRFSLNAPQPLNVQKKLPPLEDRCSLSPGNNSSIHSSRQGHSHTNSSDWRTVSQGTDGTTVASDAPSKKKKTSSWFRRLSKEDVTNAGIRSKQPSVSTTATTNPHRSGTQSTSGGPPPVPVQEKKKGFNLAFWKSDKKEYRMSLGGEFIDPSPDYEDTPSPEVAEQRSFMRNLGPGTPKSLAATSLWDDHGANSSAEANGRKIEVHQNWLARLFHIKPATRMMCFAISKRRARQEVAILLREWRKYGIRDVQVDKERDVVFARVSSKNYLNLKEVAFAIELSMVIEHGKRNHLAIARFTQERGAASSFHKVVDTIDSVFSSRGLIVTEKKKVKMMIKTLNAA